VFSFCKPSKSTLVTASPNPTLRSQKTDKKKIPYSFLRHETSVFVGFRTRFDGFTHSLFLSPSITKDSTNSLCLSRLLLARRVQIGLQCLCKIEPCRNLAPHCSQVRSSPSGSCPPLRRRIINAPRFVQAEPHLRLRLLSGTNSIPHWSHLMV
jgi:hypothetical protein